MKKANLKAKDKQERKQRIVEVSAEEMACYEGVFEGTVKIQDALTP